MLRLYGRLWGLLFFGHQFRVTRNKLSFRDNLEDLLMESGEYWLSAEQRAAKDQQGKCPASGLPQRTSSWGETRQIFHSEISLRSEAVCDQFADWTSADGATSAELV